METHTAAYTDADTLHVPPPFTAAEKVAYLHSIIPSADEHIIDAVHEQHKDREQPISSAEKIAFHRALFSKSKDPAVRNPDTLARHFLSGKWRLLYRLHWIVRPMVLRHCPETGYYHVARTKHIDALLLQSIREGIQQFVILGAGNDTRPLRFTDALAGIRVFELDFPATQARKKECMEHAFSGLPDCVTYVPIDFNTQDAMTVLKRAGFDPKKRTFFNWEGVCYFISQEAAERILSFVSRTSRGSSIVFDYIQQTLLEEDDNPNSLEFRRRQQRNGEPLRCGIETNGTASYVGRFGLQLQSDLGHRELDRLYLSHPDGTVVGKALSHFRIAHARLI